MHFLIVNLNNISRKYPRVWGSPKMTHFQIRKTSFGSFSAVSTNFKILQILRNAGRPPASNSIESRSVWPRKRRKPQLSKISKSPAANTSPYPLPLTLTPWNRKEWRMKNEEWRMITQRSTYPAENWTSNTKKPHQVILQSYFRYEPISPSYDPNEFVKNYNKKSHQKFRQLRPAKKRPYRWIFEFFLRDWLELDEILPTLTTKTKNSKKFYQKSASQNRKILQ